MKQPVHKLTVSFLSIVVGLLVCELLTRILPLRLDKTRSGIFRSHLTRGFEFIPNVSHVRWGVDWKINSKGFRDYEHQTAKTGYRIVGIGDSFFVGHEVSFEDCFLRQLEKDLKIEVIKLAVTNYGTIQERLLWEEEGRKYNPHLVLLGVYLGNDLFDNVGFPVAQCVDKGHVVPCGDASRCGVRLARFAARNSLLARFLLQEFHMHLPQGGNEKNQEPKKEDRLFRFVDSMKLLYEAKWSASTLEGFRLLVENISQLERSVVEQKASLVVVIIPTELQIYDWQWDEFLKRFSSTDSNFDRYKVTRLLLTYLEEKKIYYVNLLTMFKKAAAIDPDLHPDHWHWSVKANKLVANTVQAYLKQNKLVPVPQ